MSKDMAALASYFLPLAQALIDQANEADLDVVIIDTGRTPEEQEEKIAQGVSWVVRSKHEPQPPEGKSEAIDLCPRVLLSEKAWAPASPLWQQLGAIGEALGLRWGGRWPKQDMGHFEYHNATRPVDLGMIES
jgi:hypothetical protein